MRKLLTVAAVSLMVVGLSASMAFADSPPTRGNGLGLQMSAQAYSMEELLKVKMDRIDQLVDNGRLTEEQANEFKAAIQERMANCNGTGTGSEVNGRMAVGFGRTMARGAMNGIGNQFSR